MSAVIEVISTEKHEGDAVTLIFHQNQIFSAGADGKILIWDESLKLLQSISAHDAYIYALAISASGDLYSSSCDGVLKVTRPPYDGQQPSRELMSSENAVQSMYWNDGILYTGDDIGVVSTWQNDQLLFMYNLVEEVKSMAAENAWIYTVRDLDVVVTQIVPSKSGKFANRMVLPGRAPLILLGSKLDNNKHQYLAYADRTGKGLILTENAINKTVGFKERWQLPDCHELIITAIAGNQKVIFSGGYDNKVKAWTNLDEDHPKSLGEVDCESCINSLCCSRKNGDEHIVYIACTDGYIRKARFPQNQ